MNNASYKQGISRGVGYTQVSNAPFQWKDPFLGYGDFHDLDNTILKLYRFYHGELYAGKTASLYSDMLTYIDLKLY